MSHSAKLYACLYAREFPAQALLRLRPELRDRPFAVLEGQPPLQRVCSCNAKARLLGVTHRMTRVEMETFPSVMLLPRSHQEEIVAKATMLECAGNFSPSVEDGSEGEVFLCVIDITGTEKLHGVPMRLADALADRAWALGIASTVTVTGNFHAAICLARGLAGKKRLFVSTPGGEAEALAPLPLSVLDLTEEQAERFSLWGIHTLGMLAGLPEKGLIARMGQEGRQLRQLACGTLPHLFVPIEADFALDEWMELDSPVEALESLLFVIGVMLEQLILRAKARVLAPASVTIHLSLEGGASHSRTVRPALPTNDRHLWIKLLHLDLEAHPPHSAILSLWIAAEPGSKSKVQLGLFSPQLPEPARMDVTLARIRGIVGEENVGSPVLRDSHRPDDYQIKPFTVVSVSTKSTTLQRSIGAIRQLRPAERVSMKLLEERPFAFSFRDQHYIVECAYGPWQASGEWWNDTWNMQQWDIIARSPEGTTFCCCLVCDPNQSGWQAVALYD